MFTTCFHKKFSIWATVGSLSVSCRWPAGILSVISGCHYGSRQLAQECQKCRASANHRSLVHLASTIFVAKKLFKLQNKHCVLHSILPKKPLNINWLFLFYKVLHSELSKVIHWCWKATLGFVNKQKWLPSCGNYTTHILAKSYTAGHYQAIGDQVTMAPNDRSWDSQVAVRFHKDSSFKKYVWNIKQMSPPCFLGF